MSSIPSGAEGQLEVIEDYSPVDSTVISLREAETAKVLLQHPFGRTEIAELGFINPYGDLIRITGIINRPPSIAIYSTR